MSIDYRPVRPSIARHVFCVRNVYLHFSFLFVRCRTLVEVRTCVESFHTATSPTSFILRHLSWRLETAARITITTRWFWALLWAKSWTRANRDPSTCREVYKTRKTHSVYIPLLPKKKCIKKNKKKRRGMAFFFLPFSLYFDKVKIPQWGVSPLPSQKKKNHRRIKYFFLLFFLVFFPGSLTGAAIFDDELNQTAKMRKLRATLSTIGTHTNTYMKLVYQRAR